MPEFSREMQEKIQQPDVKKCWINHGSNFKACPNCGGWGFFSLVIAKGDPYRSPSMKGSSTSEVTFGRVVWHNTETTVHICPVCKGALRAGEEVYVPVNKFVPRRGDETIQDALRRAKQKASSG